MADQGLPIFLDLKLHDIPNTVGMAMKSLMRLAPKPAIVNVHATGGLDMMKAAADAVAGQSKLIAVTILTSLSDDDIWAAGFETAKDTQAHARALAELTKRAGLDGVVCSPHDLTGIRHDLGRDFLTVVPGIRPADAATQDQKRVATPASAIAAGADILVIGRAITGSSDPARAAQDILIESGTRLMTVQVKICGLSTAETMEAALDAGADLVGLVFFPKSPRNVSLEQAKALAGQARGRAKVVVLTVDADDALLSAIAREVKPDLIQAHGAETPVAAITALTGLPVIKAIRVRDAADIASAAAFSGAASLILYDAKAPETLGDALPGGNGHAFDWGLLEGARRPAFMLAGGLTPQNVAEAILRHWRTRSGCLFGCKSAAGIKDAGLIRKFIEAAKSAR